MCGIFGFYEFQGDSFQQGLLKDMGEIIDYRGPDDNGDFFHSGIGLGNRRLSIQDIEGGHQPFMSDDGQIIVVQNGEIFNHIELAEEVAGSEYACRTHCDTEVILRLYEKHGIDFIPKLNGMFAIAILDLRDEALYLIRDRVGEKPLHLYTSSDAIVFGSEIKSILAAGIERKVNYEALDSFLSLNYVAPPLTMFEGVRHVMPGTYFKITRSAVEEFRWWKLADVRTVDSNSEEEWIGEFNDILDDAVNIRLRADVDFGAFLSGGVDSSSVVGYMAKHLKEPVKTFSIGFHDPKFDESPYAQEAAERFQTEHVMEKVEANLLKHWSKATFHCDQPHGDVSFMPTYRVAELASRKVKMVLTGDGADELFAGYDKYKSFFADDAVEAMSDEEFVNKYHDNISLFTHEERAALYGNELRDKVDMNCSLEMVESLVHESGHMDRINQALYIDTMLLLSGNNLVKPDRMGMAVSIENRAPFLDVRMIEFAFSMPGKLKLQGGETKYIYKKAVCELIGEDLAYRKKQMFTVPISEWLKTDLKPMVQDLLFSQRAKARNLFSESYLTKLYDDHCNGTCNNTREIRALMAVEIWFRIFIDSDHLSPEIGLL